MKSLGNISFKNTLVVMLGIAIGMAVVFQPVAERYVDSLTVSLAMDKDAEETDMPEPEGHETVSSLEAVAPVTSFQVVILDYDWMSVKVEFQELNVFLRSDFIERASQKLIRVLLNFIIAPNAP